MGFEVSRGSSVVLCPVGSHVARCYMVVDEGTHPENYQGEYKGDVKKCRIGFELPMKKHTFIKEKGEEPFTLSQQFTKSLGDKAKLRKVLESWRGKPYTEESIAKFRIDRLIGQTCMVAVMHKTKKD